MTGVSVEETLSAVGGGALPDVDLPGVAVHIRPQTSAALAASRLREGAPPVLVRVKNDRLLADPRTVLDAEIVDLVEALARCV